MSRPFGCLEYHNAFFGIKTITELHTLFALFTKFGIIYFYGYFHGNIHERKTSRACDTIPDIQKTDEHPQKHFTKNIGRLFVAVIDRANCYIAAEEECILNNVKIKHLSQKIVRVLLFLKSSFGTE